ncbi:hypothetical protein Aperf_G00000022445 [Anoplocephala perfoliata]
MQTSKGQNIYMLREVCDNTLPAPECLLDNYTVPWDSTKSLTEVTEEIYYSSVKIIATLITGVGFITSLLCTLVFFFYPITQQTTRRLLVINSVVDTLYLIAISLARHGDELPLGSKSTLYTYILDGLGDCFALYRNWTIVLIAFERYMLICHPLYYKAHASLKFTNWIVVCMAVAAIMIRTPNYLSIIYQDLEKCNEAAVIFSVDAFTDVLFFTILPQCLLTFFTARILIQARNLRHWRRTESVQDAERNMAFDKMHKRIHRTIMIVLISFDILTIPFLPNGIIRMLLSLGNYSCSVYLARHITAAMAYVGSIINSTVNCFIYLTTWPKFRKVLWRMLTAPFHFDLRRDVKNSTTDAG